MKTIQTSPKHEVKHQGNQVVSLDLQLHLQLYTPRDFSCAGKVQSFGRIQTQSSFIFLITFCFFCFKVDAAICFVFRFWYWFWFFDIVAFSFNLKVQTYFVFYDKTTLVDSGDLATENAKNNLFGHPNDMEFEWHLDWSASSLQLLCRLNQCKP